MKMVKLTLLVSVVSFLSACFKAPIAPESEAILDKRLIGYWTKTKAGAPPREYGELPGWVKITKSHKHPKRYTVVFKNSNSTSTSDIYMIRYKGKLYLVYLFGGSPQSYEIWQFNFIKPKIIKAYYLTLGERKTITTSKEFQKRLDKYGDNAFEYGATYRKK